MFKLSYMKLAHTRNVTTIFLISIAGIITSACNDAESSQSTTVEGRWYTSSQVNTGQQIFADNCASCHGDKAQSLVADWKKPQTDGTYPPPPLDGSAHAWHHPLKQLFRTINRGGIALGGTMPAFADKLSNDEKLAAIAFFQSFWSEKIYTIWKERNGS